MKLSEYSDDDLIEEIKHRGFIIEIHNNFSSENRIAYIANIPFKVVIK